MNAAALVAALEYAERGWPLFPMGTSGNRKYPLTDHGRSDATRDPALIREWFEVIGAGWCGAVSRNALNLFAAWCLRGGSKIAGRCLANH